MSLLSPDTRIALLGQGAALAHGRAPLVEEDGTDPLQALETLLGRTRVRGAARVVLAHHHVRLYALPAPPVRLRARELPSWLRAQMAAMLGDDVVGAWRYTWDDAPPGQPIVVAAVHATLLDGLDALLRRHGMRRAAVVPWLTVTWARHAALGRADCWFASLTPERMILIRVVRGRPRLVRQRAAGSDAVAELLAMLARESASADTDRVPELWLESVGVMPDWAPLRAHHRIKVLAAHDSAATAMLS